MQNVDWQKIIWKPVNGALDSVLISTFLFLTTMVNIYAWAKLKNICRAISATRCFTSKPEEGGVIKPGDEPKVTIQISCYNEGNVIKETIDASCSVDWPKDKLTVQILDNSTDATIDIIEEICMQWREKGVECQQLTRTKRVGYKAGCLHDHMNAIRGDYVAMFDADHQCARNFL